MDINKGAEDWARCVRLLSVAVCCSVLQCVAGCCRVLRVLQCGVVCCICRGWMLIRALRIALDV